MTAVYYFLIFVFELFISFLYFDNKFELKTKKFVLFAVFALFLCAQYGFNFLNIPYLNLTIFAAGNFLICCFCYNTKISQALFNSCLLATLMLITELIIMYLSQIIAGINISAHNSNEIILLMQSGSSKLLYFLVAFFISKFSGKETRNDLITFKTTFLLLLPVASIILLLGIVRMTETYSINRSTYHIFSIATILLMYANIVVFWVHESSVKSQKENTFLQLQAQKSQLDTEYYSMLQRQYDNSNILIHDTKKHLLSIKNFASEGNCSDIIKYIDNLYSEYEVKNIKKYSENKLINAIINRYALAYVENHINFFCDIRNIDFSFISDNDLTAILDNLLENALEASLKSAHKEVELLIFPTNINYIVIEVSNFCASAPLTENGKFVTTKSDSSAHGYGIKSIKQAAGNYNGNISFDYDEAKNVFCAKIILQSNY